MTAIAKPAPEEYAPDYGKYISLVPTGDLIGHLGSQAAETAALLRGLPAEKGDFRYAEGKWSVKELVLHVIDMERVFAYRALCIGRGDATPLPGVEQDDYVPNCNAANRTLTDLADEFEAVRRATVLLLRGFDEAAWSRTGTASDNRITARALAHIIAGHELHHLGILRERYL
jgi:uncharacterized damage-inducible protein DinB